MRRSVLALLCATGVCSGQQTTLPARTLVSRLGALRADIEYGPHRRNKLDLFEAKSEKPAPVVFFFHGGSFRAGDKSSLLGLYGLLVKELLEAGISVAAVNYRYLPQGELTGVLADAARAVQFVRHSSKSLHIDKTRIGAFGVSAGAGISLWLASRDERADPQSADPILRESSRVRAAAILSGQFTYDLRRWKAEIGPVPPLVQLMIKSEMGRLARRCGGLDTPEARAFIKEADLIEWISKDDAPLFVFGSARRPSGVVRSFDNYVHHPRHALAIARRCKKVGLACDLCIDPHIPSVRSEALQHELRAFFVERLKRQR